MPLTICLEGHNTPTKFLLCLHVNQPVQTLNGHTFHSFLRKSTLCLRFKRKSMKIGDKALCKKEFNPAKMVADILDEIGLGRNWVFKYSTFTFKQSQNTENDEINHFQYILYTFTINLNSMSYVQCFLVKEYTHFYSNKVFLGTILLKISMVAGLFGVIWPRSPRLTGENAHSKTVWQLKLWLHFNKRSLE